MSDRLSRTQQPRPRATPLEGDVRRAVFWLALPVLLEQFLVFLVGFYDTWLSGRISSEATSAIGVAAYAGWLCSMLFSMVAVGTTALVARSWGSGDKTHANLVLNRSLSLAVLLGLGVFSILWFGATSFAGLLNLNAEAEAIAIDYLQTDAFGQMFMGISLVGAAALRGAGNMRTPMFVLGFVSLVNIVASTILVLGTDLGVRGIVLGTVIARIGGALLMLFVLLRGSSGLRVRFGLWRLRGDVSARILRIGVPAAVDGFVLWAGHMVFLKIIAHLSGGQPAFAAHVIGIQLEAITYLPAHAWGYAAATMIGQSLGAKNPDRAGRAGNEAAKQGCLLGMLITVAFLIGAGTIYGAMHTDLKVQEIGTPAFRLVACFQVPLMIGIIYVSSLKGAGETRKPLFITLFSMFCFRLPLAYYFGIHLDGGLVGAWIGMCADLLVRSILAAWVFWRGKWKTVRV